jgi:hypothetical protein
MEMCPTMHAREPSVAGRGTRSPEMHPPHEVDYPTNRTRTWSASGLYPPPRETKKCQTKARSFAAPAPSRTRKAGPPRICCVTSRYPRVGFAPAQDRRAAVAVCCGKLRHPSPTAAREHAAANPQGSGCQDRRGTISEPARQPECETNRPPPRLPPAVAKCCVIGASRLHSAPALPPDE